MMIGWIILLREGSVFAPEARFVPVNLLATKLWAAVSERLERGSDLVVLCNCGVVQYGSRIVTMGVPYCGAAPVRLEVNAAQTPSSTPKSSPLVLGREDTPW